MIPFAGDTNAMSRLPAMEKVDTARHWAELAKVGTRLGGEYRRAQADKEDLKLAGQLLNGGQPPTPEQEQTAQTGEAVFNQDQQLIDQAVQKQSSNQEISLRNNRIADMRSDPVKNEVMLKLGQSNPAMLSKRLQNGETYVRLLPIMIQEWLMVLLHLLVGGLEILAIKSKH